MTSTSRRERRAMHIVTAEEAVRLVEDGDTILIGP
jgi:hypothetical protein